MSVSSLPQGKTTLCAENSGTQSTQPNSEGGDVSMQTREAESEEARRTEQERFEVFYQGYERRKYQRFEQLAEDRDRLARKPNKPTNGH